MNERHDAKKNYGRDPVNSSQGKNYSISKDELRNILDGNDPQLLVKKAEEIAVETLKPKKKLSTSQIRNIYGTVKKIEAIDDTELKVGKLILLKPKLAYTVGRNKDVPGIKLLSNVLTNAIDLVNEKNDRFDMFSNFFEAILAYHRFNGGSTS